MLGAFIENCARRLSRQDENDLLLGVSQFERELSRERIRASRRSIPFCLISIELGRACASRRNEQTLIRLLHRHLRMTDQKGWLGRKKLGVLLVDTPEMGGRAALDRLNELTDKHGLQVRMNLRVHDPQGFGPGDGTPGAPNGEQNHDGVHVHEGHEHVHEGHERRGTKEPASRWVRLSEADVEVSAELPLTKEASIRQATKRGLDIIGAGIGLVVCSPMIIAAMVAVKLTSAGPAIFAQTREGQYGRPFTIYKLRTMDVDAEKNQDRLRADSHRDGPAFKIKHDPRVTRVGNFLRSTCIDELPQLWNVLKGDMSLVGPRPLPWHESRSCSAWHRRRLDIRPGMTCDWQVNKAAAPTFDDWMRMDLRYIDETTIARDLRLIAQTVFVPLRGKGSE